MKIRLFCLLLSCLILTGCVATNAQTVPCETTAQETGAEETTAAELSFEEIEETTHIGALRPNDDLPETLPTDGNLPEITVPVQPTVPIVEQSVSTEAENS